MTTTTNTKADREAEIRARKLAAIHKAAVETDLANAARRKTMTTVEIIDAADFDSLS